MAEIYLGARADEGLDATPVVIKRMLPHLADEPDMRSSIIDEARIMARLRHPNVVEVHELGEEGGTFHLVMEYLRGENLAGLSRPLRARGQRLEPSLAVHVVTELCAALHAAHELRSEDGEPLHVVHRDVSPQNVFVTFDGDVKLLDFGIARFEDRAGRTRTGMTKGKFAYMSPEQFHGGALDRRTDIFASGVILHELLAGKRLFARDTEVQIMRAVLGEAIPSPSACALPGPPIPPALDAICMRALARDPRDRFATAAELAAALCDVAPQLATLDAPSPTGRRAALGEVVRLVAPAARQLATLPPPPPPRARASVRDAETLPQIASAPSLPLLDVDIEIDDGIALPGERATARASRVPARRRARRRRALGAATALMACACALALCAAALLPSDTAGVEPSVALARPPLAPLAPPAPPEAASPETDPLASDAPPPEPPAPVTLEIDTTPQGARVHVGGREVGTTPLELQLDRSRTPVELVLTRHRHEPVRTTIVPDLDQRLVVPLVPETTEVAPPEPRFYPFE